MRAPGVEDITLRDDDSEQLIGRIYRPNSRGPFPAVVDVHGGAWVNGDYRNDEALCTDLAAGGVLCLSVGFRRPPVARYPEPVADIHFAIRWLKAHATELNIDGDRLGGIGLSSGGHQLMLAAMRPWDPRYSRLTAAGVGSNARLAFAVLVYPILDPLARYAFAAQTGRDGLVAGHDAYFGDTRVMEEANPQLALDRREQLETPPVLLIQGDGDTNVTMSMAERFVTAYREAGGTIELARYPRAPHGFIRDPAPDAEALEARARALSFIFEYSRPA
ncbi:alpha/beta hydrolase [Jatrophihabitans sp. DSM 45814]